jgi:hypothetical protein
LNQAILHQKIIDSRSELITKRIELEKQLQVNKLQEQRMINLEFALKAIIEKTKGSKAYSQEAYIYRIAYQAIHSE